MAGPKPPIFGDCQREVPADPVSVCVKHPQRSVQTLELRGLCFSLLGQTPGPTHPLTARLAIITFPVCARNLFKRRLRNFPSLALAMDAPFFHRSLCRWRHVQGLSSSPLIGPDRRPFLLHGAWVEKKKRWIPRILRFLAPNHPKCEILYLVYSEAETPKSRGDLEA